MSSWLVCADTGGTFTDVLALPPGPGSTWSRLKVLSIGCWRARVRWESDDCFVPTHEPARGLDLTGWRASGIEVVGRAAGGGWKLASAPGTPRPASLDLATGEEAPVLGWRLLSSTPLGSPLPRCEFRLATTRATNALLEGKTARVALFLTEGLGDLLDIGSQQRPELFSLVDATTPPAHKPIIEVPGRLDAQGLELEPVPDRGEWLERARGCLDDGIRDAAVCLLHAHRSPAHEHRVAALLRALGFERITCSADLSPLARYLPRARTTLVHASLVPVMDGYLDRVASALGASRLLVMTSAGALVGRAEFRARDSLMSGPAGGLNAAAALGKACAAKAVVTFDMGGTSTDVGRFAGAPTRRSEVEVGGVRLQAPALPIESVAAGGGSICRLGPDGLQVGPESAGSSPGPACYGKGGPLTLTDLHLLLGRIRPTLFSFPPDLEAARARLLELHRQWAPPPGTSPEDLAVRLLEVADETMAGALRAVTLKDGHDPRGHVLVAYGGAGGLHACGLAQRLGLDAVLSPCNAGLFSAEGLSTTAIERIEETALPPTPLHEAAALIAQTCKRLTQLASTRLPQHDTEPAATEEISLRRRGHDFALHCPWSSGAAGASAFFAARYATLFGLEIDARELEVCAARVTLALPSPAPQAEEFPEGAVRVPTETASVRTAHGDVEAAVHPRSALSAGELLRGPALVQDTSSSFWLPEGWTARVGSRGTLRAEPPQAPAPAAGRRALAPEIVRARLSHLVRDMGHQLGATAVSVNIRERLDYSCALLDHDGRLVMHAPHVPVHLGSLGVCVRALHAALGAEPGAIYLTNHPGHGGSHLPDVTVAAPVHDDSGLLLGWVANRAHHAEIGGRVPGSLPVDARCLEDEGVVLPPTRIARAGTLELAAWERALREASWPSRRPEENTADLRAQVAALRLGAARLAALASEIGGDAVRAASEAIRAEGRARMVAALRARGAFSVEAADALDDGSVLRARLSSDATALRIDFSGTSPRHPLNFNATPAIVRSAVLYVLRVWLGGDLPLNEGVLEPVEIVLPEGSLLNPGFLGAPADLPAVMGGNVETSQRVVDVLLTALDLGAQSQGTMNNFVFGDATRSFYETIGGGGGAAQGGPGRSGRHVHMTNTAIADPEILEERYPVRLRRFSLRAGSGGTGLHRGGDGLVREVEFLQAMNVSLLTQRRTRAPAGAHGGAPGQTGSQSLRRPLEASATELPGVCGFEVAPGAVLTLRTPGGGGWGTQR